VIPRIFVYGTLRPAGPLHGQVLGPYVTSHRRAVLFDHALYAVGLPYPAAVPRPGCRVVGDVVELDPRRISEALEVVDFFEGDGYRRDVVTVRTADGEVDAWVYLAAEPDSLPGTALVPSGDWLQVR